MKERLTFSIEHSCFGALTAQLVDQLREAIPDGFQKHGIETLFFDEAGLPEAGLSPPVYLHPDQYGHDSIGFSDVGHFRASADCDGPNRVRMDIFLRAGLATTFVIRARTDVEMMVDKTKPWLWTSLQGILEKILFVPQAVNIDPDTVVWRVVNKSNDSDLGASLGQEFRSQLLEFGPETGATTEAATVFIGDAGGELTRIQAGVRTYYLLTDIQEESSIAEAIYLRATICYALKGVRELLSQHYAEGLDAAKSALDLVEGSSAAAEKVLHDLFLRRRRLLADSETLTSIRAQLALIDSQRALLTPKYSNPSQTEPVHGLPTVDTIERRELEYMHLVPVRSLYELVNSTNAHALEATGDLANMLAARSNLSIQKTILRSQYTAIVIALFSFIIALLAFTASKGDVLWFLQQKL